MRQGLSFSNAIVGLEFLVGDGCGVRLVPVDIRKVPTQEHFQLEAVDKMCGIRGDGVEKSLIMLISFELGFPIRFSRDEDGVQPEAVLPDEQVGIEPELPVPVLHRLGNDDPEVQVHAPAALRYVAEAGCDPRRLQDIRGHHFSVLVLDGAHDQHLVAVRVFHDHRVPARFRGHFDFRQFLLIGDDHLGAQGLAAEPFQFPLGAAAGKADECHQDGPRYPPFLHRYRNLWG